MEEKPNNEKMKFSLTKDALKLLGQNLYSNSFNAISELVANSIDAKAAEILIHLDMVDKKNSKLLILDSGCGMSKKELEENYLKIGYKKRNSKGLSQEDSETVMGRKGIGKLAALYLSDSYSIYTKKLDEEQIEMWRVDLKNGDDNEPLSLNKINSINNQEIKEWFSNNKKGTALEIYPINLKGIGEQKIEDFKKELSIFFLTDKIANSIIKIKIDTEQEQNSEYQIIEKKYDFHPFLELIHSFENEKKMIEEMEKESAYYKEDKIFEKYKDNFSKEQEDKLKSIYKKKISNFDKKITVGKKKFKDKDGIEKELDWKITGWIGIKREIKKTGKGNLKLYIRNKLAVKNLVSSLHLRDTQVFSNYIVGEITFDVLDDNQLADITTSNRQDIDIKDERVELLKEKLNQIVGGLFAKRTSFVKELEKFEKQFKEKKDSELKTELINKGKQFSDDKERVKYYESEIKGEILKEEAKIFISHSSNDNKITTILYEIFINKLGFAEKDFFYTSKLNRENEEFEKYKSLNEAIKENIKNISTHMMYFLSNSFFESNYCLFEAGAGWATKSYDSYSVFSPSSNTLDDISILNTNRQKITLLFQKDIYDLIENISPNESVSDTLKKFDDQKIRKLIQLYNDVVNIINKSIKHLNLKRFSDKKVNELEPIRNTTQDYVNAFKEKITKENSIEEAIFEFIKESLIAFGNEEKLKLENKCCKKCGNCKKCQEKAIKNYTQELAIN